MRIWAAWLGIGALLTLGGYVDYKKRIIPHTVTIGVFALGFLFPGPRDLQWYSFGIFLAASLLVAFMAHLRGMKQSGAGDIKTYAALCFAIGLLGGMLCYLGSAGLRKLHLRLRPSAKTEDKTYPACVYLAGAYWLYFIIFALIGGLFL